MKITELKNIIANIKKKKALKGKLNRRVEMTVARICEPEGRSIEFVQY